MGSNTPKHMCKHQQRRRVFSVPRLFPAHHQTTVIPYTDRGGRHPEQPSIRKVNVPKEPLGSPIAEPRPQVVCQTVGVRAGRLGRPTDRLAHREDLESFLGEQ